MEHLDFASVMAVLRRNINEESCPNQMDLICTLFQDVDDDPRHGVDFDNGQVCRWINGLAKLSPGIISFYQDKHNQRKLAQTIEEAILPMMPDCAMAAQELYDLVLQAPNVSPQKKMELTDGYTFEDENDEAIFIMEILCLAILPTDLSAEKQCLMVEKMACGCPAHPTDLPDSRNGECFIQSTQLCGGKEVSFFAVLSGLEISSPKDDTGKSQPQLWCRFCPG